jgi:hypothetical protein
MASTTKAERALRLAYAKRALIAAGWSPDTSAGGIIASDLMKRFDIKDRRTARQLEARAARLLRGDVVTDAKLGRPRKYVRVLIERMPPDLQAALQETSNE